MSAQAKVSLESPAVPAKAAAVATPPPTCPSVTTNGKTRYFSYNSPPLIGIKESAILVFAPVYGFFMLMVSLLFLVIQAKTTGAIHWVTLIIALLSLWSTGKTAYNWYQAKSFLDKNMKDTCDAPPAPAPAPTTPAAAKIAKSI